jgi:hypothetical protein
MRANHSIGDSFTGTEVRRAISIGVVLAVALIHLLRPGSHLHGAPFTLYYSFFSDIAGPLAFYFLLCACDHRLPRLRDWRVKSLLVFGIASCTEVAQGFGIPLLGRTFDPLDFVMFAAGASLAAAMDRILFEKCVPGWSAGK